MTTWFVTGSSRGLGGAIARHALAQGHQVAATARNPKSVTDALGAHDDLLAVALDVTDRQQIGDAVAATVERFGSIDVVVNNAGGVLMGALEEMGDKQIRDQFDLNVFGVIDVVRAVLPTLRAQRSGTIVNTSSLGGVIGVAAASMYNATKFAVEGLTAALREELAELGISVMAIEPGSFRTDLMKPESMALAERHGAIGAYDGTVARHRVDEFASTDQVQEGNPAALAALVFDVVMAGNLPTRLPIGPDAVAATAHRVETDAAELAPWRDRALATNF
jgi:NAD(P)-dependent dehydrogenase (short-subunit alcohol dehydrogenase family)